MPSLLDAIEEPFVTKSGLYVRPREGVNEIPAVPAPQTLSRARPHPELREKLANARGHELHRNGCED
jgi:hypothetical protein